MSKENQFQNVGQVVDYLRTNKELEVINDDELPKSTRKDESFPLDLAYGNPGYKLATSMREPKAKMYVRVDTATVPAFVAADDSNIEYGGEQFKFSERPAVQVWRRANPEEPARQIAAHPITQEEFVFLTRDTAPILAPSYQSHIYGLNRIVPNPSGWSYVRSAPVPFKLGDDAYFEARRDFSVYGKVAVDFGRFQNPIQRAVLNAITRKTKLALNRCPNSGGRNIQAAASIGGMMLARYAQKHTAMERASFRDWIAEVPLTFAGIDLAYKTINAYAAALSKPGIVELQAKHEQITRELEELPDKALEFLV